MIRVALETATRVGSVGVARADRVLAELTLGVQTRHAETALPALDAALRLAGVSRSEIGAVVVGAGPGSFTGVRVAGATAKGLATSLDVPLLAYSSLLALAVEGAVGSLPVCGLFDARRGEVYAGCWRIGSDPGFREAEGGGEAGDTGLPAQVMAPGVGPIEEVVAGLAEALDAGDGASPRVVFVGEGVERYRDELVAAAAAVGLGALLPGLPGRPVRPRAAGLLWLAHHHPGHGVVGDVGSWEPEYVRGSSAERGIPG